MLYSNIIILHRIHTDAHINMTVLTAQVIKQWDESSVRYKVVSINSTAELELHKSFAQLKLSCYMKVCMHPFYSYIQAECR